MSAVPKFMVVGLIRGGGGTVRLIRPFDGGELYTERENIEVNKPFFFRLIRHSSSQVSLTFQITF